MIYHGSCHCGNIAFDVEGEVQGLMECNCSICRSRGYILWFVPRTQLKLKTPQEGLSTYQFNKKVVQHHFCAKCGSAPFGEGINPKDNVMIAAVNVRCLEGLDWSKHKITQFDGKSL